MSTNERAETREVGAGGYAARLSAILVGALSGRDERYIHTHEDGYRYTRWGLVQDDVVAVADEASSEIARLQDALAAALRRAEEAERREGALREAIRHYPPKHKSDCARTHHAMQIFSYERVGWNLPDCTCGLAAALSAADPAETAPEPSR
jgi:hypothetical protein